MWSSRIIRVDRRYVFGRVDSWRRKQATLASVILLEHDSVSIFRCLRSSIPQLWPGFSAGSNRTNYSGVAFPHIRVNCSWLKWPHPKALVEKGWENAGTSNPSRFIHWLETVSPFPALPQPWSFLQGFGAFGPVGCLGASWHIKKCCCWWW